MLDEKLSLMIRALVLGAKFTVLYTLFSLTLGLVLGSFFAILKQSNFRLFNWIISIYVSIIRGTPVTGQLIIFHSLIGGGSFKIHLVMVLALTINSTAYVTESISSGIRSIDIKQFQAAKLLGIPRYLMWKDIIIPQLVANMLPVVTNEAVSLLKETSVASFIGGVDITSQAKVAAARTRMYLLSHFCACLFYYILSFSIERLLKVLLLLVNKSNNKFSIANRG